MKAVDSARGHAPDIARSLTVPLTARSPMLPPGKNSGRTTKESVEKATRVPPTDRTAESVSSPVVPNAGRKRCSTSSADIAPPPPCPICTVGESRSGTGQLHAARSSTGPAGRCPFGSATAAARRRLEQLQPAVQVVGGAGALGADHGRAERGARRALPAERRALVRLDQPLQDLAGPADRRLVGVHAADVEPGLGVELPVRLRQAPAAV